MITTLDILTIEIAISIGIALFFLIRSIIKKHDEHSAMPVLPKAEPDPEPLPEEIRRLALGQPMLLPKVKDPVIVVLPKAESIDEKPFCDEDEAFEGINREKERKRLERVLEGLYNRRDKYEYMGKSHNTQAWKGLEYDIMTIENRLKFFTYEA